MTNSTDRVDGTHVVGIDLGGTRLRVALADSSGDVVLDLDGVTFMDSSGLQCVIDATRHLRANDGDLTLRRPGPAVRRLIEITGLDTYLRVDL